MTESNEPVVGGISWVDLTVENADSKCSSGNNRQRDR